MILRNKSRGFSLLELLTAVTISVLAVAVASSAMINQYKFMLKVDLTRISNNSNRDAITQIEAGLRRLGWGVDPRFAIDMIYNCACNFPDGGVCAAANPCTTIPGTNGARDSATGPDQLIFVARNPEYMWVDQGQPYDGGTCAAGSPGNGCFVGGNAWSGSTGWSALTVGASATLTLAQTVNFEKGRVLLATCANGASPVMLTLPQAYVGGGTSVTFNAENYPYNDVGGLQSCHKNDLGAGIFLVDRFHYFIESFDAGMGQTTPWLMLDTGRDLDGDGTVGSANDFIPVAKDIEDMQVAYILNTGTGTGPDCGGPTGGCGSGQDWIVGNTPGQVEHLNPWPTPQCQPTPPARWIRLVLPRARRMCAPSASPCGFDPIKWIKPWRRPGRVTRSRERRTARDTY